MAKAGSIALWGLTLLLAGPAAAAQKAELFKCEDGAGVISIQSAPCAKGSTQVWKRDATPEPAPTPEQAAQAAARRERDQAAVRELSREVERKLKPEPEPEPTPPPAGDTVASEPAAEAPDRCAQAQDFAAQVREKTWLALNEDQIRRLYAWVGSQCQPTASVD